MTTVRFIGYIEYQPTHFHAEFQVRGHHALPEGAQVNFDTLRAFKIAVPDFPSIWVWRRERFGRLVQNSKMLRNLMGPR